MKDNMQKVYIIHSSSCNIVIQETPVKLKDFQYKASFASLGAEGGGMAPLAGCAVEAAGRLEISGAGVSTSWVSLGSWASCKKSSTFGVLHSGLFWGEERKVNDRFSPLDPLAFPVDSRSESLVPAGYWPVL